MLTGAGDGYRGGVPRVLLVAPGADPSDVGEAWVGAQWALHLAQQHSVTLLTYRKRDREPVAWPTHHLEVVEWLEPPLLGRTERFNSLLKPWYPDFGRRVRAWVGQARAAGRTFDIGFQPTPVAMRYPSPLSRTGLPYVVGPVGGGLDTPPGFASEDTAPWYVNLRKADALRLQYDPWLRRSYERAAVVLAIAPYAEATLRRHLALTDVRLMAETALSELPQVAPRTTRPGPVRLLFVGRLIRTKGARDAIRAMSHLASLPVHLDVVGDGFDRKACEDLAQSLGVRELVTFHGSQTRAEVGAHYAAADVFVFPSYREPGGNVQFEAMGHALPLVLADRGGPAAAVTADCAILVRPTAPEDYARRLADAITRLVTDPELRLAMGRAARAHVETSGTWAARAAALSEIMTDVVERGRLAPRRHP